MLNSLLGGPLLPGPYSIFPDLRLMPAVWCILSFPLVVVGLISCGGSNASAPGGPPAISVAVLPASSSVQTGETTQFRATLVNDDQNKGVTWTLSGAGCTGNTCGTLSSSIANPVSYTAPANVPNPSTVRLTATSVADSTKSGTATITLALNTNGSGTPSLVQHVSCSNTLGIIGAA